MQLVLKDNRWQGYDRQAVMLTPQGAGVTEGALRTWVETVLTGTVCSDANVCLARARWRDRDGSWGWQLRLATVEAVIAAGFHLQVASRGVTVGEQVVEIKVRRARRHSLEVRQEV